MPSIAKGTFSVRGVSTAKIGGNIFETIITGSGNGYEGSAAFQVIVLSTIEAIIRNCHDSDYDLAPILLLADQPTAGQNFPLSLLTVPEEIIQSQVPSAALLQAFLLKDNSLTQGTTTQLTETAIVKLTEYIATQSFSALQKASKIITENETIENDFSENIENGRLSTLIENSVFSIHITIQ